MKPFVLHMAFRGYFVRHVVEGILSYRRSSCASAITLRSSSSRTRCAKHHADPDAIRPLLSTSTPLGVITVGTIPREDGQRVELPMPNDLRADHEFEDGRPRYHNLLLDGLVLSPERREDAELILPRGDPITVTEPEEVDSASTADPLQLRTIRGGDGQQEQDNECACCICREALDPDDPGRQRVVACGHAFHAECKYPRAVLESFHRDALYAERGCGMRLQLRVGKVRTTVTIFVRPCPE
ncbi:unnamed protein product [Amoebophrya sp. A25]|nr:unnamed protein product [Amoebophrya sp. A25]|eukprot:GSA25T00021663001.1